MKQTEIILHHLDELPDVARNILRFCEGRKVYALYGDMGAGKTTLVKALCRQLGSTDHLSSPTYSVVNEYHVPDSAFPIYHIDLYRLHDVNEARAIGLDEYLNGNAYCFVEWPEVAAALLPAQTVKISIRIHENIRIVSIFIN